MNKLEQLEQFTETPFEAIKHFDEEGNEFWYARELQKVLGYTKWSNFRQVLSKAMTSCENAGISITDCFADVGKSIISGKGKQAIIEDFALNRYACYLIAQNGDPRKEIIAQAQTYFAVQTRRQEFQEQFDQLAEDQRRLSIREELVEHNKSLVNAAQQAGVNNPRDFAIFQNKGYQGLYGGLGQKEIHERKNLSKSQRILDHMGSEELAANLFRATQTDAKLRRENIQGKDAANETHFNVGAKVRQTIKDLGGTMPEDLPTPEKSIKTIRKEEQKRLLRGDILTNKTYYPIILEPAEEGGYLVYVPDFDAYTQGTDYANALYMARDLIALLGIDMLENHKEIPSASDFDAVYVDEETHQIKVLVDVDFYKYRRMI